jgi:hypothetical protein
MKGESKNREFSRGERERKAILIERERKKKRFVLTCFGRVFFWGGTRKPRGKETFFSRCGEAREREREKGHESEQIKTKLQFFQIHQFIFFIFFLSLSVSLSFSFIFLLSSFS